MQKQIELLTSQIAKTEQQLVELRQTNIELEQKLDAETDARLKAEAAAQLEAQKRAEVEEELSVQKELTAQANAEAGVHEEANASMRTAIPFEIRDTERSDEPASEIPAPSQAEPVKTQPCDCCGTEVPQTELTKIDSGHLFCHDCFTALRR